MNEEQQQMEVETIESGREVVVPTQRKAGLVAGDEGYIIPTTVEEALRMAKAVIAGNLAPDSYNNDPNKVMLGLMAALEAGLPPLYGLRQIAIINGRPSLWGDACQALIQKSGQLVGLTTEWIGPDGFDPLKEPDLTKWPMEYGCIVRMWRKGQSEPYVGQFTVGDAKRAQLWLNARKVPWMQHPRRMMMIRARAFPQRDGFADALAGLSIREEVEDTFGAEVPQANVNLSDAPAVEAPPLPQE